MTDRPTHRPEDAHDDRPLTPAEEERVRRLLADARHTEPAPDDVVSRLDAVLAGLAAEGTAAGSGADAVVADGPGAEAGRAGAGAARPDGTSPDEASGAPVADLAAARRRRRRLTQVLVAAAAVTVVGVTGPQLLGGAGDMMTAESDSTSAGDAGGADTSAESGPQAAIEQDGDVEDSLGGEESRSLAAPELTGDSLLSEAQRLREASPEPEAVYGSESLAKSAVSACRDGAAWGPGRRVLVTFEGADAVLVYRPASDGVQRVDLLLCGDDTPTRSLTLPAP